MARDGIAGGFRGDRTLPVGISHPQAGGPWWKARAVIGNAVGGIID
jgi:hypothetical protein